MSDLTIHESNEVQTSQRKQPEQEIAREIAAELFNLYLPGESPYVGRGRRFMERCESRIATALAAASSAQRHVEYTHLLQKIVEICDEGSSQEFRDADERLRAIRGLIIGEAV